MNRLDLHNRTLRRRLSTVFIASLLAASIPLIEARASDLKTLRRQPITMQGNLILRVGSLPLPVPLRLPSGLQPISFADAYVADSDPTSPSAIAIRFHPADEQRVYNWAKSYRMDFGAKAHATWHTRHASWTLPDPTTPGGWSLARHPLSQLPGSPPQRWSINGSLIVGAEVLGIDWSGRPSWPHSDDPPERTIELDVYFAKRHNARTQTHPQP